MLNIIHNIGLTEIAVAAVIIVFLFAGKKLPEFGKGIGEAFKTFKQAFKRL